MSRVGNRILTIPSGVTLENNQNLIRLNEKEKFFDNYH